MSELVYSVPVELASSRPGQPVILRAADPGNLLSLPAGYRIEDILYIRLYGIGAPPLPDIFSNSGIAIDYVLTNAADQSATLYNLSRLLSGCDLRVSIPMQPGFSRAVKLAAALSFTVKLEYSGSFPGMSAELAETLDIYLHQSTVSQPIDFFHSLLLHFIHQDAVTLWQIQEEDPALYRQINGQGQEVMAGLSTRRPLPASPASFVTDLQKELSATDSECRDCPFMDCCGGYWKWPNRELSCAEYQLPEVFHILRNAALELRRDQEAFSRDAAGRSGAEP